LRLPDKPSIRYGMHQGKIANQAEQLAAQWRILFAQAIIQLEMAELPSTEKVETPI
jgi:adenylate cyclase